MAKADMFIKFEGIDGESAVKGFEKHIQIDSFSWGVSNSSSMHQGGGGGVGKAQFQDIHFTKYADQATGPLMEYCANGKHIPTAKITCRKADGSGNPMQYYVIEFEKAFVTSVQNSGASAAQLMESVSFSFEKIKFHYQPQNSDGTPGSTVDYEFNVREMA